MLAAVVFAPSPRKRGEGIATNAAASALLGNEGRYDPRRGIARFSVLRVGRRLSISR
jgi:hypothetical protein